jgi:hypothetical protein
MSGNENNSAVFLANLKRFRSAWRRGLVLALALRVAGWAASGLALYFVADFFLALDETVRTGLNILLPLALAVAAAPEAIRIARLGMGETAERADLIGKHRRKEALTAWELLRAAKGPGSAAGTEALPAFLVQRSVDDALARLAVLEPAVVRPRDQLSRQGRLFGIQVLIALAVVRLCGIPAFMTIASRMLWPGRDIPPYSHYRFEVTPAAPVILYGGSAEIAATIRGAPVEARVWMMTRRVGQKVQRAACFQESGDRYAQRLENVTAPVEFCFAVGRARSRWHAVDLQLQPQVVLSRVRLMPPAYTRLMVREFPAGQEDVAGVRGTKVTLTLTSNRPLREGVLTLEGRHAAKGSGQVVAGRPVSERSMSFDWILQEDAEAKATLRDVRGTPTAEPLVVHQKRVPDEAPKTVLTEPREFSMATPSAKIKVEGTVEDDFGIEQIDLIRSVVGFNDRGVTLRRGAEGTRAGFDTELNLGTLGVEAGQVLEFYAEALDNNPVLPGVGVSPVARVKVISDEDYAEILRNRETLEQFTARYEAATEAIQRVIESLEELQGLVLWKNPDRARLAETVKKALDAHTAAESLFRQLADDFAAYDSEKTLKQTAADILGTLAENKAELAAMREPAPENTAKAEAMLKRLGAEAESLMRQAINAEAAAEVAKVMDNAARFQAVVKRQEALVRRLKQRYGAKVNTADLPFLPGYGEDQDAIAGELAGFEKDAAAAAEALPPGMEQLGEDVRVFLAALEESGASNHMRLAVSASRNTDAARTTREALLALEKLQELLRVDPQGGTNTFVDMCRGQKPDFGGAGEMEKTLEQMFRSLCRKRGVGEGQGEGQGQGEGNGQGKGTGSEGYSELGTPVYGPGRNSMGKGTASDGKTGKGEGRGSGAGGAGRSPDVVERLPGTDWTAPSGEAIQFERLPAKYRDAVKRYFQRNGKEGGER